MSPDADEQCVARASATRTEIFPSDTIAQYYPIQLSKVRKLLQGLLDNPERFNDHNKMCVYPRSR